MKKLLVIGLIALILAAAIAFFIYAEYQKYSPLAKVEWSFESAKVTYLDMEKVKFDFGIGALNPTPSNTEIPRIDFSVFIDNKFAGNGQIFNQKIPAEKETTIYIKDFTVKYSDIAEVLGGLINEGKSKVNVRIDIVIYYPFLFTETKIGPIQIEKEVDFFDYISELSSILGHLGRSTLSKRRF